MNSLNAITLDLAGIFTNAKIRIRTYLKVNLKVVCIGYSNVLNDTDLVFPVFQGTGPKLRPGLYYLV